MDRHMDGQTDGRLDAWIFTPVSYRTSALMGRCPKRKGDSVANSRLQGTKDRKEKKKEKGLMITG